MAAVAVAHQLVVNPKSTRSATPSPAPGAYAQNGGTGKRVAKPSLEDEPTKAQTSAAGHSSQHTWHTNMQQDFSVHCLQRSE